MGNLVYKNLPDVSTIEDYLQAKNRNVSEQEVWEKARLSGKVPNFTDIYLYKTFDNFVQTISSDIAENNSKVFKNELGLKIENYINEMQEELIELQQWRENRYAEIKDSVNYFQDKKTIDTMYIERKYGIIEDVPEECFDNKMALSQAIGKVSTDKNLIEKVIVERTRINWLSDNPTVYIGETNVLKIKDIKELKNNLVEQIASSETMVQQVWITLENELKKQVGHRMVM